MQCYLSSITAGHIHNYFVSTCSMPKVELTVVHRSAAVLFCLIASDQYERFFNALCCSFQLHNFFNNMLSQLIPEGNGPAPLIRAFNINKRGSIYGMFV